MVTDVLLEEDHEEVRIEFCRSVLVVEICRVQLTYSIGWYFYSVLIGLGVRKFALVCFKSFIGVSQMTDFLLNNEASQDT